MESAASLHDLVQRLQTFDSSLPSLLYCETPTADDVIHIDEECPILSRVHFGVSFPTRSLQYISDHLTCSSCLTLSHRRETLDALEEPLSDVLAVLAACTRHDAGLARSVNLGSLLNGLRPSVWVRQAAIDVLLRALEQRFPPDLPEVGSAWLVMRGAGAPLVLLPDGLHHASGYSVLLLPPNMLLSAGPSRPLSVSNPYQPRWLCDHVTEAELQAARHLFFQMVTGGTEPSVALQAALVV